MRKTALGSVLFAGTLLAVAVTVEAQQQKKLPRIGYLAFGGARNSVRVEAFRRGLRQLGYVEGKDILIEYRFAEGKLDRLNEQTTELVHLKVNLESRQSKFLQLRARTVDFFRHGLAASR